MAENHPVLPDSIFDQGGRPVDTPQWAQFYAAAGSLLAGTCPRQNRTCLIFLVPVRTMAAVFLATGVVVGRVRNGSDKSDAHFEMLQSLPEGTSVVFRKGGRKYVGRLQKRPDKIGVLVTNRKKGGGTEYWLSPKRALQVAPVDKVVKHLPNRTIGRSISANTDIIEAILLGIRGQVFLSDSSSDCLIVGQKSVIREEVYERKFAIRTEKKPVEGRLQDFLRLKNFVPDGDTCRCEVTSSSGNELNISPGFECPHVVIFDGASGYLKWRCRFPESHLAVVAEYGDTHLGDLLKEYREEAMYRASDFNLSRLPKPPSGTEITGYVGS